MKPVALFVSPAIQSWNGFWFAGGDLHALRLLKLAIFSFTAVWFATFLPAVEGWFGERGWLNIATTTSLVHYQQPSTVMYRWSPLWWTSLSLAYYAWLVSGITFAALSAFGVGARWSRIVLVLLVIGWSHRIAWLNSSVEPALIPLLGYLVFAPLDPTDTRSKHWQAGTVLRMVQVHWWLLIAAGLLSQLAGMVWWRGEAAWWLASSGHSYLLSVEQMRNNAVLTNLITHGVVAIQFATLWLITIPATRPLAIVCGACVSLSVALIADQILYGILLAASLTAFLKNRT